MYFVYRLDSSNSYLSLKDFFIEYYTNYYILSIFKRLQILFINDNYQWASEPYGSIIAVIISLILFTPLIFKIIQDKKLKLTLNKNDFEGYILKVIIICALIFYFILPDDMPGQNIIYQRFSIFIWLGLIPLFSRFNLKYLSRYKVILIGFLLIFQVYIFEYFISFQNVCKDFTAEIFSGIKKTERVYGLFYDPYYRGRPVFIHFQNYFTIWNQGISAGVVDYRFSIIKRKTNLNILPVYKPWAGNLEEFNNEYPDVEYILCRSENPKDINNFIIFKKYNYWIIYQNLKLNNK